MLLYNFLIIKVSKYILKIHNFSTHYHHPFQQIFITCLQHRSHCADYSSVSLFPHGGVEKAGALESEESVWAWISILQLTAFAILALLANFS